MSSLNQPGLPDDDLPSLEHPYLSSYPPSSVQRHCTTTPVNNQKQGTFEDEFQVPPPKPGLKPGFQNPCKHFLKTQEFFDTVITVEPLYCAIPSDEKNNILFTLNNYRNIMMRQKNCKADYMDDNGVWDNITH